jgi:hypothetical protein
MRNLILILVLLVNSLVYAQNTLAPAFIDRNQDTILVKELIMFSQEQKDSSVALLHEVYGLSVSEKLNFIMGLSFFNYRLAKRAMFYNSYVRAESYLLSAGKGLTTEPILISINKELLNCYRFKRDTLKVNSLLFDFYKNDKNHRAEWYALLKSAFNQKELSVEQEKIFLSLPESLNDQIFMARYFLLKNIKDSALFYLNSVLDTINNLSSIQQRAESKLLYARFYRESNDLKNASALIVPVISIFDSLKSYSLLIEALNEYAKICFAHKKWPLTQQALSRASKVALVSGDSSLIKGQFSFMANFYSYIGNSSLAKIYNDSMLIYSSGRLIANNSSNIGYSLVFEDKIQKCYKALGEKLEKKSAWLNINVLIVLVGLIFILLVIFVFIYLKKRPLTIKEEIIIEKVLPAKEIVKEVVVEVNKTGPNKNLITLFNHLNLNGTSLNKVFKESLLINSDTHQQSFAWMADLRLSRNSPVRGVFLALARVNENGESAACLNIQLYDFLNRIVKEKNILQPSAVLNHLNRMFHEYKKVAQQNWECSLALCFINSDNKELLFCGSNLNISVVRSGKAYDIKGDDAVIGNSDLSYNFQDNSLELIKNDVLIMESTQALTVASLIERLNRDTDFDEIKSEIHQNFETDSSLILIKI